MAPSIADPGSFRDPDGRIFSVDGRVLRGLSAQGAQDWAALERAPWFRDAVERGQIVRTERRTADVPNEIGDTYDAVLEHERIPFLSYPYEWTFSMLRDAALLHLDLLLAALDAGFGMKDGYAYNVQFRGSEPVFIDVGSFVPSADGPWPGYRQFCETFLYPLMLTGTCGMAFQPLLRGRVDGIPPTEMAALLGRSRALRPGVLKHVLLHAALERRTSDASSQETAAGLKRAGFDAELSRATTKSLRKLVGKLTWDAAESAWSAYRHTCSYDDADRLAKDDYVKRTLADTGPHGLTWDLGCNDGAYSLIAADHSDHVVAADFDPLTVDLLYRQLRSNGERRIQPLVLDLTDPSPGIGWRNRERRAFLDRSSPDAVLALALIHHLVITAAIPMAEVLDLLASLDALVVIEFVEPDDPMARKLLANKPAGRHDDYSRECFERLAEARFDEVERLPLPSGRRTLYTLRPRG